MTISTTASQVAAAVNAKAGALVTVTNFAGNDGTGIVTSMPVMSLAGGNADTAASGSLDPAGSNNKLTFTAAAKGADGNKIRVLYVDPGDGSPLDVLVLDGRVIYIILGDAPAGTPGRASGYAELTTDTTAIGTWTWDDTGLSVTLTLPAGTSGKVLLTATLHTRLANADQVCALRFVIDGVAQNRIGSNRYSNAVGLQENISMIVIGLSSGNHTFKVQGKNLTDGYSFEVDGPPWQSNLSAVEL